MKLRSRIVTVTWSHGVGALGLLAMACGADAQAEDDDIGRVREEIFRGHPLIQPSHAGIVLVSGSHLCTGTMLTSRWVLTAAHCFCPQDLENPHTVTITPYGNQDASQHPAESAAFMSSAARIIRHENLMDVALIEVARDIPVAHPVNLYTGDGSDLSGQLQCWGFGNTGYVNGDPTQDPDGAGDQLTMGEVQFDRLDSGTATSGLNCNNVFTFFSNPGFYTKPTTTDTSSSEHHFVMGGDSGGPCFTGNGQNRVLVGVNSAAADFQSNGNTQNKHVGVWHFRDWIRQNTDIWSRSRCTQTIPGSSGVVDPALATIDDGTWPLHLVARSGNQIKHWKSGNGETWTAVTVPSDATTDRIPAIAQDLNPGVRLGLAYREPGTGAIKYRLWSNSGGWAAPVPNMTGVTTDTGPALSRGMLFYVRTNGRPGGGFWVESSNAWGVGDVTAASPNANTQKHPSIISEPSIGAAYAGYWSSSGQFMKVLGSWSFCSPTEFWCPAAAATPLAYSPRVIGYNPTEGIYTASKMNNNDLIFEFDTDTFSRFWGYVDDRTQGEPAIMHSGDRMWIAYAVSAGIRFRPLDNCLGNTPPGW